MHDYWLNALVTLFITIDPVGLAPIFLAVTAGMLRQERRATALRSTLVAAAVLIFFALVGERLIGVLGISLAAFRIAGGLLLFWISFEMVFARREERKAETVKRLTQEEISHIAVVPMAVPLTAGPGSIAAAILLSSRATGAVELIGLLAIIVALIGSCYAVFLAADSLDRLLGTTGRAVLSRLLGIVLAALSVQFVADGVLAFARSG